MENDELLRQPIGYWLNRCDQAITASMNKRLNDFGLDRGEWQMLNLLAKQSAVPESSLFKMLKANADCSALAGFIKNLIQQQWVFQVQSNPVEYALTETGRIQWQIANKQVGTFRQELLDGVSEDDYLTTLSVLRQLIQNAERSVQE